ncbi:MAG: hypothetical protein AB7K68_12585 [Bacteriovoracia bacterium]
MMGTFTDQDRVLLAQACRALEGARRPPERLTDQVEASWCALLAEGARSIGVEVFSGGDREDAVSRLVEKAGEAKEPTLYLTLEPKATFARLPPVTESIRRLGVKRVVIGCLDPAQKLRGEGTTTLERMGVEVVLADGEEARLAQTLLDPYSKWLHKGVATLEARVELHPGTNGVDLQFSQQDILPSSVDAVIYRAGKVPAQPIGSAWQVVLDAEGWERPAPRRVLYQSNEAPQIPGTRRLAFENGFPDLGALLRDLASLGLLTLELSDDPDLFRLALRFGLIENLKFPADTVQALARAEKVRFLQGGTPLELRFDNTRYSELSGPNRYLEARVELC